MKQLNNTQSARTYVVTLIYGNRFMFLQQVVEAALANNVSKVIIVDNGSAAESCKAIHKMEQDSNGRVTIVALPENRGSAAGYKAGLEYAMRCSDCEFIWLLDDDNRPDEGALAELLNQYERLSCVVPTDRLALVSLRDDWESHKKLVLGIPPSKVFPRKSSFMGFHLRDQPGRLLELFHLYWLAKKQAVSRLPIEIPFAPYGGLFFHNSLISKLGYPDERFFLYHDDTEYTYRLTKTGGRVFLVPSSVVFDLERSWHLLNKGETLFSHLLINDSDFRIYYGTRNQSYIDRHMWATSSIMYTLNKLAFFVLLSIFTLWYGKWKRFLMVARAVRQGELAELGIREDVGK